MGGSSKLGGLNRFAIGWLGFAGGLAGVLDVVGRMVFVCGFVWMGTDFDWLYLMGA